MRTILLAILILRSCVCLASVKFDDVDDFAVQLTTEAFPTPGQEITIMFWWYPTKLPAAGYGYMLGKGTAGAWNSWWWANENTNMRVRVNYMVSGSLQSYGWNNGFVIGKWQHMAFCHKLGVGALARMYVNGVQGGGWIAGTGANTTGTYGAPWYIGANPGGSYDSYYSCIKIFNKLLSQEEVIKEMEIGAPVNAPYTIHMWPCDDTAGSRLSDYAPIGLRNSLIFSPSTMRGFNPPITYFMEAQ